jgi:hypothetical protein
MNSPPKNINAYVYELPMASFLHREMERRWERELKKLLLKQKAKIDNEWSRKLGSVLLQKDQEILKLREELKKTQKEK